MTLKYGCLLIMIFITLGCNFGKEEKKEKISSKEYFIDSNINKEFIISNGISLNTELILSENGTYHFIPKNEVLSEIEGEWDLSGDWGYSNYIFKYNNGLVFTTNNLKFKIQNDSVYTHIYFNVR